MDKIRPFIIWGGGRVCAAVIPVHPDCLSLHSRQWVLRIPALSQDSSAPQRAAVTLLYSQQGNEDKSPLSTIPAI